MHITWMRLALPCLQMPFPSDMQATAAAERHRQLHPGASLTADTLAAHHDVGLLRDHTVAGTGYSYLGTGLWHLCPDGFP